MILIVSIPVCLLIVITLLYIHTKLSLPDYLIAAMPVNDYIRRRFIDKGDDDEIMINGKGYNWWHQLKCVFPSLLFAFGLCTAIPRFEVLTSILSSLTLVPLVTFVPSIWWLYGDNMKKHKSTLFMHCVSIVFGVVVMGAELAYAIYGIITTEYVHPSDFWCQSS